MVSIYTFVFFLTLVADSYTTCSSLCHHILRVTQANQILIEKTNSQLLTIQDLFNDIYDTIVKSPPSAPPNGPAPPGIPPAPMLPPNSPPIPPNMLLGNFTDGIIFLWESYPFFVTMVVMTFIIYMVMCVNYICKIHNIHNTHNTHNKEGADALI